MRVVNCGYVCKRGKGGSTSIIGQYYLCQREKAALQDLRCRISYAIAC